MARPTTEIYGKAMKAIKIKPKYFDCDFSPEMLKLIEAWNNALRAYEDRCYGEICKRMVEEVDQKIMRVKDDL